MKTKKSKIKILIVGPYPPPFSGPESSIKFLLESPLSEKAILRLINTNYRKDVATKGKKDFIACLGILSLFCKVFFQSITFRPDVVYYYVTATIPGWLYKDIWMILAARLGFRKVVIHMRAGHFRFNYDSASTWRKFLIRIACRHCCAGLVQGKDLRNQFDMVMPTEKIHVVHNMIDTCKYVNSVPASYQKHRFLFLGHLSFAKGYCDLLEVIPKIVTDFQDCKFVFAGYKLTQERNIFINQLTGEQLISKDPEMYFEKYIHGICDKNYVYLGAIAEEQKLDELKKCSAVILPSYSEGFSMSVLEALSIGKPVICTPVGALREIVHDKKNGFIIPPGNILALENSIRSVLAGTKVVKKMRKDNHQYVKQNFSFSVIANQLYEIFLSVTQKK